jgi:asparagine synthase (glutamine-hydrolysing)
MGAILSLSWEDGQAASLVRPVVAAAGAAGFRRLSGGARGWLGVAGPRAPRLHDLHGGLLVLGDWFEPIGQKTPLQGGRLARLSGVVGACWGRYVALARDGEGRTRAVLRDPSGTFEVICWRSGPVQIVSTGTPDWLLRVAPAPVRIDWSRTGALLVDPLAGLSRPPLDGLDVLDAGEMIDLELGARRQVWRPNDAREAAQDDTVAAGRALRARVETCVHTLTGAVSRPGAELSGGLDSAIIAAALGPGRSRLAAWINARSARPETDEPRYAEAVAAHLCVPLTFVAREERPLSAETLMRTAGGVRPGYNGADPVFDALLAEASRSNGLAGLLTGKGGDALFFQGASAAVFGDLWRRKGARALLHPDLAGVARWTRKSVWAVFREGVLRRIPASDEPRTPFGMVCAAPEAPVHPWLDDLDALPPGKQLQLRALTSNLAYTTACRRTEVVDLVHPLMAQPLIELAMAIPTPVLTGGRTDRWLARQAFADSLPSSVVWRQSKGDYTATFEREAAASLPFLRSWLLDGLLASHGVIDRSQLEPLLDRDRLMWAGGGAMLSGMAVVEAWLRTWSERSAIG